MTEKVASQSDDMFSANVDDLTEPTLEPNETPDSTEADGKEPESVETKVDTAPESIDEPEGEPTGEPDAEPEPEPTGEPTGKDYSPLMDELGLTKEFGNAEAVLRLTPQMRAENTRLQQERADLLRTIQQQQQSASRQSDPLPPVTGDDFIENPEAAFKRLMQQNGLVPANQMQQHVDSTIARSLDEQRAIIYRNSMSDFDELEPAMEVLVQEFPSTKQMPVDEAYKFLHEVARARKAAAATPSQQQVEPAPGADKKGRANTSGARSSGSKTSVKTTGKEPTSEEFYAMSLEEQRAYHGYGDT